MPRVALDSVIGKGILLLPAVPELSEGKASAN
jgi:hypothetical protein